jgi:hypothetical protein
MFQIPHRKLLGNKSLIVLACIASNALGVFATGLYFDGWLLWAFLENPPEIMQAFFSRAGLPLAHYTYLLLSELAPYPFGFKLVGLLAHVATSVLLFQILEGSQCNQSYALPSALLYAVNPFSISIIEPTHVFYAICSLFLIFAIRIIQRSQFNKNYHLFIAIVLLVFAFSTHSLLVIFYGWLIFLFYNFLVSERARFSSDQRLTIASLVLLPLIYWSFRNQFFKPYGDQALYNQIHFDIETCLILFNRTIEMLLQLAIALMNTLVQTPTIAILTTILIFCILRKSKFDFHSKASVREFVIHLSIFVIIFICTALPYNLVQKGFALGLNQDRQNFLLAIPLSMLAASQFSLLAKYSKSIAFCFFCSTIAISLILVNDRLANYSARSIKDRFLVQTILNIEDRFNPDVIVLQDKIKIQSKFEDVNWYIDHFLTGALAANNKNFDTIGLVSDVSITEKISKQEISDFVVKYKLTNYVKVSNVDKQVFVQLEFKKRPDTTFDLLYDYVDMVIIDEDSAKFNHTYFQTKITTLM